NFAALTVSYNGTAGEALALDPVADNIHMLNTCDATKAPADRDPNLAGPCRAIAAHLDGKLITADNPATVGETVTLYAFGAGPTAGRVRTGAPPEQTSSSIQDLLIGYRVGANLEAS